MLLLFSMMCLTIVCCRKAVVLSDEQRYMKLLTVVQNNIRHYVPLVEMRKLSQRKVTLDAATIPTGFNFLSLYQVVGLPF